MDEKSDRPGWTENKGGASQVCIFLQNPSPDCYCMQMTGRNILKMVAFCAADYKSCSIYRSKAASGDTAKDPGRPLKQDDRGGLP